MEVSWPAIAGPVPSGLVSQLCIPSSQCLWGGGGRFMWPWQLGGCWVVYRDAFFFWGGGGNMAGLGKQDQTMLKVRIFACLYVCMFVCLFVCFCCQNNMGSFGTERLFCFWGLCGYLWYCHEAGSNMIPNHLNNSVSSTCWNWDFGWMLTYIYRKKHAWIYASIWREYVGMLQKYGLGNDGEYLHVNVLISVSPLNSIILLYG